MKLELGGIYENYLTTSGGKILTFKARVLVFDRFEVFFDEFINDRWERFVRTKRYNFSRDSTQSFIRTATFIDLLPLTENEEKIICPDLPMRIGRLEKLSWNNSVFISYDNLIHYLYENSPSMLTEVINLKEVFVFPIGAKGGYGKEVLITAQNSKSFTVPELLFKAGQVQRNFYLRESCGIGIFRNGIRGGKPSFYIGDYIDQGGILKELVPASPRA